jgi:preprotein translocase subunit YajC
MSVWFVPIAVAVISGPLVVLMSRFDKRNTEQHDRNMQELKRIGDAVDDVGVKVTKIDDRLDRHVEWHLHRDESA